MEGSTQRGNVLLKQVLVMVSKSRPVKSTVPVNHKTFTVDHVLFNLLQARRKISLGRLVPLITSLGFVGDVVTGTHLKPTYLCVCVCVCVCV